jgi:hypothetical protein
VFPLLAAAYKDSGKMDPRFAIDKIRRFIETLAVTMSHKLIARRSGWRAQQFAIDFGWRRLPLRASTRFIRIQSTAFPMVPNELLPREARSMAFNFIAQNAFRLPFTGFRGT